MGSTYHQVHHGSNRYCLDKNYGGFLSIWDRIFGTFQDLRPDEQTVYGLVDPPKFFNVVKHQLFYFPALLDKVPDGTWLVPRPSKDGRQQPCSRDSAKRETFYLSSS